LVTEGSTEKVARPSRVDPAKMERDISDKVDDIYELSWEKKTHPTEIALVILRSESSKGNDKRAALFVRARQIILTEHKKNVLLTSIHH
jgi:hypothetical protein